MFPVKFGCKSDKQHIDKYISIIAVSETDMAGKMFFGIETRVKKQLDCSKQLVQHNPFVRHWGCKSPIFIS